jgi:hypothetical protein
MVSHHGPLVQAVLFSNTGMPPKIFTTKVLGVYTANNVEKQRHTHPALKRLSNQLNILLPDQLPPARHSFGHIQAREPDRLSPPSASYDSIALACSLPLTSRSLTEHKSGLHALRLMKRLAFLGLKPKSGTTSKALLL